MIFYDHAVVNVRSTSKHPLTLLSHKILKVYIYRTENDACVIILRSGIINVSFYGASVR